MKIEVLTLFPELVEQAGKHGMPRIAVEGGALQLSTRNPRDYSGNKWRRVDDRPYGGGPGMVMEAEPLARAIADARAELGDVRVIGLSPQGQPLTQAWVEKLYDSAYRQSTEDERALALVYLKRWLETRRE